MKHFACKANTVWQRTSPTSPPTTASCISPAPWISLQPPDRGLEHADLLYYLFVLVLPFAWLSAHALDVVVNHRSCGTAGFVFHGGLLTGGALFFLVGTCLLSVNAVLIAANAAVIPPLSPPSHRLIVHEVPRPTSFRPIARRTCTALASPR